MSRIPGRALHRCLAGLVALAVGSAVLTASPAAALVTAPLPVEADAVTVIAHRGDRQAAPENTGAAFRSAIFKRADAIEMDVRFTRTGVPVVIHDETVDRTTDCSGRVAAFSLAELSRCDAGSWFGREFGGERVPTLQAALGEISVFSDSINTLVHLKTITSPWQAKKVLDTVIAQGMKERTIFIADQLPFLEAMRSAGAERLGYIFYWPSGWTHHYPYMIPQDASIDAADVRAAHRWGAVVFALEGPVDGVAGLRSRAPIDGALANNLSAARPSRPAGDSDGTAKVSAPSRGRSAPVENMDLAAGTLAARHALSTRDTSSIDAMYSGYGLTSGHPDFELTSVTSTIDGPWPTARAASVPDGVPRSAAVTGVYGPFPATFGGWRPSGRLRGPGAELGS